jgi:hypothetical protein
MLLRFRPSCALRDSPSRKLALESRILLQATSGRVGAAHFVAAFGFSLKRTQLHRSAVYARLGHPTWTSHGCKSGGCRCPIELPLCSSALPRLHFC